MEVLMVSGGKRVMVRLHAPDNRALDAIISNALAPWASRTWTYASC